MKKMKGGNYEYAVADLFSCRLNLNQTDLKNV